MKLYAVSDLHLAQRAHRRSLEALPAYPEDWLILAGDIGETADQLSYALQILTRRFDRLIWVPGNHDLWTLPAESGGLRGVAKYQHLVSICRDYGVLTPEDPYVLWPGEGTQYLLVPTFLLYDYSFRPDDVAEERALDWALEADTLCTDEVLLHPDPYPSRAAWCIARCRYTEERLERVRAGVPIVLVNHFPLHRSLVRLQSIPRFSLWCGTRRTEDWHRRFALAVVVYGHLHLPCSQLFEGMRCEEVSFAYPHSQPDAPRLETFLRQILPIPDRAVKMQDV